jgi:hypothetical protein
MIIFGEESFCNEIGTLREYTVHDFYGICQVHGKGPEVTYQHLCKGPIGTASKDVF